ncbi:cyclohexanone monooxygenase [Lentinula raphanica]|uniref:Cyclohexanone monooxygenase n=1 Tax=Lentinula raphanica TaxID=153919 RepID=A0AA38PB15_9AGAR|nr:cyclohexanone monooxygenase [Lentinula raphanica]KAJ3968302.1 cyclohexanone monooxygenase [Lentinula raphanica]
MSHTNTYDVIIIGAGFSGVHQLLNIRKLGLSVKVFEAGEDLAGTWYWNQYPGARVDSPKPLYQFSDPEIWRDWTFTESYPDGKQLRAYFEHVDQKFDIKRDVSFNSLVVSAHWDDTVDRWTVTLKDGQTFQAQFLSLCTGIGSKSYTPNFKGIDSFKGEMHHTSRWPVNCDLTGKRVGIIGTGPTAVQIIQEIAPIVTHLTVFQRTPNMALPMRQRKLIPEEEAKVKRDLYEVSFKRRPQTFTGLQYDIYSKLARDATPEERELTFEEHWERGGFHFWMGTYADLLIDQNVNDEAYAFWRKKVRERIPDPVLQEKLAPMKPPHPFGVRRPSLEQGYFEIYSRPNVTLVDISNDGLQEITPKGVKTSDGTEHELDVLILATGFDMLTGGITSIDIRGQDGVPIKEKWANGVQSYLGVAGATYPNMFWIYGPLSPSSFTNGPSIIELTSEWVIGCIKFMKENNLSSIVPTAEAQHAYSELVEQIGSAFLWSKAKTSWYMGSNIEGKKKQMLQFPGGIPAWMKLCNDSAERGYEGFHIKSVTAEKP